MSNNPGSASALAKETQPPQRDKRRSRGHHPNRTKPLIVKFKGKCEELKDAIFEILSASGSNSFTKAKRDIAEYVACKIPGAGEFRTAMINMDLEPLVEPEFPPDQMMSVPWKYGEKTTRSTSSARRKKK